jgi:DNA-binding NarL/FixJ family response regulator
MQSYPGLSPFAGHARIFVIEAEQVVRTALHYILREEHEAHAFATIEEAVCQGPDGQPSVVLLGIGMVRNKGLHFLTELASWLRDAKILLVADSTSDPLALAGLKGGAHGIVGKPISTESVRNAVQLALGTPPYARTRTHRISLMAG